MHSCRVRVQNSLKVVFLNFIILVIYKHTMAKPAVSAAQLNCTTSLILTTQQSNNLNYDVRMQQVDSGGASLNAAAAAVRGQA